MTRRNGGDHAPAGERALAAPVTGWRGRRVSAFLGIGFAIALLIGAWLFVRLI
jgi:hypothetical protein